MEFQGGSKFQEFREFQGGSKFLKYKKCRFRCDSRHFRSGNWSKIHSEYVVDHTEIEFRTPLIVSKILEFLEFLEFLKFQESQDFRPPLKFQMSHELRYGHY